MNKVNFLPNQMVRARCFRGEATASATTSYVKSATSGGIQDL